MDDQRPLISDLQKNIKVILADRDPINLMEAGCPRDEYSPESQAIAQQLTKGMSVYDITTVVYGEFIRWFNIKIAGKREEYIDIANDISILLNEND